MFEQEVMNHSSYNTARIRFPICAVVFPCAAGHLCASRNLLTCVRNHLQLPLYVFVHFACHLHSSGIYELIMQCCISLYVPVHPFLAARMPAGNAQYQEDGQDSPVFI